MQNIDITPYLTAQQERQVRTLNEHRVAEYNNALLTAKHYNIGANSQEALAQGRDWLHRLRFCPRAEPWGETGNVALLVMASSNEYAGQIGQVRTVQPNTDSDTRGKYPWSLVDNPSVKVSGFIPRDYVSPRDNVWVPGHGFNTVDGVHRTDGVVTHLTLRGDREVGMWFRTTAPSPLGAPQAGDWVLAQNIPGREEAEGVAAKVIDVDPSTGLVYLMVEGERLAATRVLPLQDSLGHYIRGTILQPRTAMEGATPDFIEHAKKHPAVVDDYVNGRPRVRPSAQYRDMLIYTVEGSTADVLGHIASPRPVPGFDREKVRLGGPHFDSAWVEPDDIEDGSAVPTEDNSVDWKAKYEALVVALQEEAEERDWCSEFDEFCERNDVAARLSKYEVTVTMEVELDAHKADRVLRSFLNEEDRDVDVREALTITHRAAVEVLTTRQALRDGAANEVVSAALTEAGWRFDEFDIEDWDRA